MKILTILLALFVGLFGVRLLINGLRNLTTYFTLKSDRVSDKAKETLFRDLILGILLIILMVVILT
ncbi:MAG: hypothetical protein B6242_09340 [Anaerolineaceae bacterium 4572_78]|nr:MAG: hypothetical protein B6242_09340 [Anaerolineaceae bacterium 4572_78]